MPKSPYFSYDEETQRLECRGVWDLQNLNTLIVLLKDLKTDSAKKLIINGEQLTHLDSAAAWFLINYQQKLEGKGIKVEYEGFLPRQNHLLKIVEKKKVEEKSSKLPKLGQVELVGKYFIEQMRGSLVFLSFVGLLTKEFLRLLIKTSRWRFAAICNVIYRTGFLALPIIALLSFMIGVVITFQMGLQLKNYGANIYIVDLLGIAILREFGPLLTAIMVSGRTGSSYTAQLGMMKINQEIDALNTMGVTPAELLLLPRIFGLVIVLPLLTIWADIFGVWGGLIMSNSMLDITPHDFLSRFPHAVKLKNLIIGLGKAPIFALIIATIGCYQGMRVGTSADSVGRNTTRSVVLSIFFIIVADAIFSILFSKLKL